MNSEKNWDPCVGCKWWQIEPEASLENATMGVCVEEKLQKFVLRVSGNSGCNRFQSGKPRRREGSSTKEPFQELVEAN